MNNPDATDSKYVPIDCDIHSQYELACIRRRPVRLTWVVGNVVYDQVVTPIDLQTVAHAEFLVVKLAGDATQRVRLDHIRHMVSA